MKLWRIANILVVVLSLGAALNLYWHYRLKESELAQHQGLRQVSSTALTKVSAELIQNKKALQESRQEIARLNKHIAALEKDNLNSRSEFKTLRKKKQRLQAKMERLSDEKSILQQRFLSLEERLHSLEELKKAIRVAKKEHRQRSRAERIKRHLTNIEMLKELDEIALKQGNRGYLVREGGPGFKASRIRVELEPVRSFSNNKEKE